jgi:hypothetical protein
MNRHRVGGAVRKRSMEVEKRWQELTTSLGWVGSSGLSPPAICLEGSLSSCLGRNVFRVPATIRSVHTVGQGGERIVTLWAGTLLIRRQTDHITAARSVPLCHIRRYHIPSQRRDRPL